MKTLQNCTSKIYEMLFSQQPEVVYIFTLVSSVSSYSNQNMMKDDVILMLTSSDCSQRYKFCNACN